MDKAQEQAIKAAVEEFVAGLMAILNRVKAEEKAAPPDSAETLDKDILAEVAFHEGAVLEAYKDSKGVWTWGIGVTDASGHRVGRYKDNPQTLKRVFEVYEWLLRTKYLPDVLEAFKGHPLTKNQLAAALSFHYNTGGIKKASWVKSFKEGQHQKAREEFLNWRKPPEILKRRKAERDLFFDGVWAGDGTTLLYQKVNRPSYTPKWSSAKRINIEEVLSS